jgi:hypothetical protein
VISQEAYEGMALKNADQAQRIEQLETALAGLISHWREFGEMIVFNNAVNRDDYGFDERMEHAARLVPDRVP